MARPKGSKVIDGKYFSPEEVRKMNKPRRRAQTARVQQALADTGTFTGCDPTSGILCLEATITEVEIRLNGLKEALALVKGS